MKKWKKFKNDKMKNVMICPGFACGHDCLEEDANKSR